MKHILYKHLERTLWRIIRFASWEGICKFQQKGKLQSWSDMMKRLYRPLRALGEITISLRSYCRHFFRLWSCLILGISKGISNTIFAMLTSQRMNRKDNWEISHPKLIHCCWNERGVDREHAHLCKPPLGKILQTNSLYNFCTGLGKILDVVNRSAHHSNKKAKDENCCTARGWPSWTLGFCAPSWFMSFLGAAGLMVLQINFMDSRSLILL